MYELHIYTMGDKAYAREIAGLIDPQGKLFAGRVVSAADRCDRCTAARGCFPSFVSSPCCLLQARASAATGRSVQRHFTLTRVVYLNPNKTQHQDAREGPGRAACL